MKRLIASHLDCDGLGSIILYLKYKHLPGLDFDTFMLIDYGWEQIPENITYMSSFDEVIMADISAPKEYIDQIRAKGTRVRIFDHHLSSEWLREDPDSVWDKERCGTRIFWEEYAAKIVKRYPYAVKHFIQLVDTYDCWREDSPLWSEAKDLNSVLYGLKNYKAGNEIDSNQEFIDTVLRKLDLFPNEWIWLPKEKRIIQDALKREEELYKQAKESMRIRIDHKGKCFGLITLGSKISLICSRILSENSAMDYIICINSYRGINGKLSFRTKLSDLDLNTFAGVHGHAAAAGAKVSPETASKIWEQDYVPVYLDELESPPGDTDDTPFVFYDQDEAFPF